MKKTARRGRQSSAPRARPSRWWVLPLILAVAGTLKLAVLWQLHGHPLLQPRPGLDSAVYLDLARQVASGDLLAGTRVFFVSPFYIYFVALVLFVSGGSVTALQVVQVALGVLAVALVGRTARFWYGERGEWVAAGCATATGYLCFNDVLVLQSAVDPVLTALGLWLLLQAWTTGRWTTLLAAGAALGAHAINRPNVLAWAVTAVGLTLWIGLRPGSVVGGKPAGRRAAWSASALVAGLALVLTPVAIRNYVVAHELAVVSSHGGLNFYIGNNERADGAYRLVAGITPSIDGQMRDMRRVAEQATGHPLTDTEASSWFYGQAFSWIGGHPGTALRLLAKKVAFVFNAIDLPLNESYAYYATDESTLLRLLCVGPWLLLPLGVAGLWIARPKPDVGGMLRALWWPWVSFIPIYALGVAVFFVTGRYRLPLLVPLFVTSAGAVLTVWDRYRAREWKPFGVAVASIAVLGVATNANVGMDNGLSAWRAEMIVHDIGVRRDAEAQALLEKTEAGYPNRSLLLYRVGSAYLARGDAAQALPLFERAVSLAAGRPELELGLGRSLLGVGRAADALPHLQAAVQAEPRNADAQEARGLALAFQGRGTEAVAAMETACELDVRSATARLNLAILYAESGRLADARARAEESLRINPDYSRALEFLAALPPR
ncbi:MAG TPA: tetratricopeptide repeat protein [Vicinamibacterales bacterium]